jgi:hypothetical protein
VLISIPDYETNSQSTLAAESLLSQDPARMAEAWTTEFSVATVARDTGVERDETCVRVKFLPVASHITPAVIACPASHAAPEIPGRCEGRGRAASASRRVRSPARGERRQLADGKIKLRAADNRVAAGRDLQGIMNLLPLQAPMDLSPCARPSSEAARRSRQCVYAPCGVAVDRRGKRKRRNRLCVCLALGVATNSPPWAASSAPVIAEAESATRPTLIANKNILASG